MGAPHEIVAAPLTVYLAVVGTAYPAINAAPAAAWVKIGTSGDKNYDEDGVTVTHEQTLEVFRPAGTTGARKVWRTEEEFLIEFNLVDISAAQYAKVLNDLTVTAEAGPPALSRFELKRGIAVATFALLARGASPVDDTKNAQYQVPIAYQAENPAPVYKKGEPATLKVQMAALEHDTDGFGRLVIAT